VKQVVWHILSALVGVRESVAGWVCVSVCECVGKCVCFCMCARCVCILSALCMHGVCILYVCVKGEIIWGGGTTNV
jgi:hypothetical protein